MGSGATTTTASFTCPASGNATLEVVDNTAFPPFSYLLVTDGVSSFCSGPVIQQNSTTEIIFTVQFSTPGNVIAPNSTVTFTGSPGVSGASGMPGPQGLQGPQGLPGIGATFTIAPFTCTPAGSSSYALIEVEDNTAFPPNSYFLATDGVSATVFGQVIGVSTNQLYFNVLDSTVGNILNSGSIVTFAGPQGVASTVPGPEGPPGFGLPGHGATNTTQSILMYPIGTFIPVSVVDSNAFPIYSYVLISDGVYAITGQVTAVNNSTNILSIRINSIVSGYPGLTSIANNANVTFTGPPGLPGVTNIGDLGTVFFKNLIINPSISFQSGNLAFNGPSVIGSLNFFLPNNQPITYKVIADFNGTVITNQILQPNTNIAYLGIASNSAVQNAYESYGTFAGINQQTQPGPIITYQNVVADGGCEVNSLLNLNINNNVQLKYVGTFSAGSQIDFTIVALAQQFNTSFYVSGILEVRCYPIYQ